MKNFTISFTSNGTIANAITNPQSLSESMVTWNASAKNGTEITPNWRIKPTMIAPTRYLFENKPTWKIDFVAFLIVRE